MPFLYNSSLYPETPPGKTNVPGDLIIYIYLGFLITQILGRGNGPMPNLSKKVSATINNS